ncbi:DUF192 domain-containing protein [Halococcus dombrowskii]|uniref:DUF192 domain-containing protein n=1 Tax=Halococcus dombrowskii TaxID=179637 RepID=A0AAX3AP62_HALDO|nr:DUF192 domain-containing protein [Halococcus dombrowskii]UOO95879.1 DUF192 domain-containing protein [Halococcus dombrowskii]
MNRGRVLNVLFALAVVALALTTAVATGVVPPPATLFDTGEYDHAEIAITNNCSQELGTVDVRIAESRQQKIVGLSETPTLRNGSGMLFPYDDSGDHTYVMRGMDYPLDIVFVGGDGRINAIESAPAPGPNQDGNDIQRTGTGKYVLEVPRGWMESHEIDVGHSVTIDRS